MDYKTLLFKYMALVIGCEDYAYLEMAEADTFTTEEMAELMNIQMDIYQKEQDELKDVSLDNGLRS